MLKKIAENQNTLSILQSKPYVLNVPELMKSSFDRPKVSAIQDTLNGIIPISSELKLGQRKFQKYKHWGGIKIPVGADMNFHRHKDILNKLDEQRDGIFYQL